MWMRPLRHATLEFVELPVIDINVLRHDPSGVAARAVGAQIDAACRNFGFFAITGHGVDGDLALRLDEAAREFFALPDDTKAKIAMRHGGRAWRGWFPLHGELTSGRPDQKEGIYFGRELSERDPRVLAGLPLHGANLFPQHPQSLKPLVLEWLDVMTQLAHTVLCGMALGLGLDPQWFAEHLTQDPTVLFRIFRYPPAPPDTWGVQTHTDYGLLTLLVQDDCGGLQVRVGGEWIDVAGGRDTIICNLGDMLDRMTAGRYRSTPHRVRNTTNRERISLPFFFDPSWNAEVAAIPFDDPPPHDDRDSRWDGTSLRHLSGTYGEYLTAKIAKVFPELGGDVLT